MLVFENKRTDEIHDNRRTEGEEREVNEIHANTRSLNAEFFAQPRAHSEKLKFKQRNDFIFLFRIHTSFFKILAPILQIKHFLWSQKLVLSSINACDSAAF